MKDAQQPNLVTLGTLLTNLKSGAYVIPQFQRDFEWTPWDIRELMRSIFLDYFVGTLLLWKASPENISALACQSIYGRDDDPVSKGQHIVLDGQQRLTAIYYAFTAPNLPLPGRKNRFRFYIKVDRFMDGADDAFDYHWTQWGHAALTDLNTQFERHLFSLSVVGEGGFALATWVHGYTTFWETCAKAADADGTHGQAAECRRLAEAGKTFGEMVNDIDKRYQIGYTQLEKNLEIDRVCEIFANLNSKGVRLDIFDLLNALVLPTGVELRRLWRAAKARLEFVESDRMNIYVLQVMSILRQDGYCSPKYLYYLMPGQRRMVRDVDGSLRAVSVVQDPDDFRALWHRAVTALANAVAELRDDGSFGVTAPRYLPYASILPAFAALRDEALALPHWSRAGGLRKTALWYWASVFMQRYSGSVESTAAKDFSAVKAWFQDDEAVPPVIADFKRRFRTFDLRTEIRPGNSVYNGFFNLLVVNGARDWVTGMLPASGRDDDHHIVPQRFAKELGLGWRIDTILNRTPLSPETNRHIMRDRLPNQYLNEWIDKTGAERVTHILATHLISPTAMSILMRNPFTSTDFDEFIAERDRSFKEAVDRLILEERTSLDPETRDLDERIEQAELGIRALVAHVLDGEKRLLPDQVLKRAEERSGVDQRKRPALDPTYYARLEGLLEYLDFQDLRTVITSTALWDRFEPLFRSKGIVETRWNQLADLRNAIRHSRPLDNLLRHDGQAALTWFKQVLSGSPAPQIAPPEVADEPTAVEAANG
jgi:Protein of unknown function DUF262